MLWKIEMVTVLHTNCNLKSITIQHN